MFDSNGYMAYLKFIFDGIKVLNKEFFIRTMPPSILGLKMFEFGLMQNNLVLS